mgnify:CR=1 FL=1
MHKYFIILLIILVVLVTIFTIIVYNELITLRNAVTASWKDLTKSIDEYMKLSGNDTNEYNKLIAVEDIIDYFYKVDSNDPKLEDIKEQIKSQKRVYNDYALALNNKTMLFPFNLVASFFGFSKWPYFRD